MMIMALSQFLGLTTPSTRKAFLCRFRIWTTKGKKKLTEFLADMGLPLSQCKQKFSSMDMDIRKEVCGWIEVRSEDHVERESVF